MCVFATLEPLQNFSPLPSYFLGIYLEGGEMIEYWVTCISTEMFAHVDHGIFRADVQEDITPFLTPLSGQDRGVYLLSGGGRSEGKGGW